MILLSICICYSRLKGVIGEMKGVSVFVPVYNEESSIRANILRIHEFLADSLKSFELIVVDDSSTDETPKILKDLESEVGIRQIRYENGPSRRENLARAFSNAKYDYVVYMDADLATDLSYLPKIIESISGRADIAIGSRYKGMAPKRRLYRRFISHLYNAFMMFYFSSRVKDHQCGFKAFRKPALLSLVRDMGYDHAFRRGWFWDAELLIRAQKKKFIVDEIPVKWHFGSKSTFSIARELRMIPYVLALRRRI